MLQIVSGFFSGILYTLQLLYFSIVALDEKINIFRKKKLIGISLLFSCFYSFIFLCFDGILKTLLFIIGGIFLHKYIFNISLSKSLFMNFIYMFLLMIPDLLVLFFAINLFGMSKQYCYDVFAGSFLGSLSIFLLFIFLVFLIKKPLKKLLDTQIDTDKKIILFSLLTLVCILLFFYTIIDKFRFTNDVLLYLMCIFILALVLINLIKQVVDNRKLSAKYDKLSEFMTTYEIEIEKQRILRHEIKNEFLVLKAKLLDSQKKDEIVNYIDEILKDKIIVNQEKYAKFGYLPPGIKGLCYFKVQEAENKGIQVSINVSKKLRKFNINLLSLSGQRNLARILGVFLDNAREASVTSKEKKMGIEIYFDKDEELKFIISNTFDNKIDINKIGKVAFSTKGSSRGHGLMLVNYILETNKIFNIKTDIKNNVYVQNLSIKLKNK